MKISQAQQNARLLVGVGAAMILSLLNLTSVLSRVPTLAVILRRKMRRAVSNRPQPLLIAGDPDQLWRQNNTLPGNRRTGFRFDYLLVMIVATPIYLWFELSFGVNLLDTMGGDKPPEAIDAIEHWGRIISGIAVALVFLKNWFNECEKWNRSWPVRIVVSIAICLVSIRMTWEIQDAVIEFYVKRGRSEVTLGLAALSILAIGGVLTFRLWMRHSVLKRKRGILPTLAGLIVIVLIGSALIANLNYLLTALTRQFGFAEQLTANLGRERQQAATLALVRRGLQQGTYSIEDFLANKEILHSAEGKATLALLPIIASGMDQSRFADDRAAILQEVMYLDWDEQYGDNSYAAVVGAENDLRTIHAGGYREFSSTYRAKLKTKGRAEADAQWEEDTRYLFGGEKVSPGLSLDGFLNSPFAPRFMAKALGCFDCVFRVGMSREEATRELFKWTQANNVNQALSVLESPEHFESSRDGETAARSYWVPIWALLFSMVGAFTHLFKMAFTLTEYVQRKSFSRAKAADSELADAVVWNAKILIGIAILALALFIFFSDNRVTGNAKYLDLHANMWRSQPIVGAVAAHWTINAQALIYPFTKKIRPDWLSFSNDPLEWLPIKKKGNEYE